MSRIPTCALNFCAWSSGLKSCSAYSNPWVTVYLSAWSSFSALWSVLYFISDTQDFLTPQSIQPNHWPWPLGASLLPSPPLSPLWAISVLSLFMPQHVKVIFSVHRSRASKCWKGAKASLEEVSNHIMRDTHSQSKLHMEIQPREF